jgi:hypothetical protein
MVFVERESPRNPIEPKIKPSPASPTTPSMAEAAAQRELAAGDHAMRTHRWQIAALEGADVPPLRRRR